MTDPTETPADLAALLALRLAARDQNAGSAPGAEVPDWFPHLCHAAGQFWHCPGALWQPLPRPRVNLLVRRLVARIDPARRATEAFIRAVVSDLAHRVAVPPDAWDNPGASIPLANGLLDPVTGQLTSHQRAGFIATVLPYDYDPAADCPAWRGFLQTTLPGAADFLQEFAGCCLTRDTHHEIAVWLYGPPGSGKSTCLAGLQALLGPFAGPLDLDALERGQLSASALRGKTLVVSHQPPAGRLPAAHTLAALISGEPLFHGVQSPPSEPVHAFAKHVWAFTGPPRLHGDLSVLYRRLAVLAFPPLPQPARDPGLRQRLSLEGPGLFNWALAGLRRLRQRGRFQPPPAVLAATRHFQQLTGTPAAFFTECCQPDPACRAQALDLYRAYLAWCHARGLQPATPHHLAAHWRRLGLKRHRIEGRTFWYGVALLAPTEPPGLPQPAPES